MGEMSLYDSIKGLDPTERLILANVGLGAISEFYKGLSQSRNISFQADQARSNAKMAEYASREVRSDAAFVERKVRQGYKAVAGKQKVQAAASGLDVGVGAPVEAVSETVRAGEADIRQVRRNAARESWGLDVQASQYKHQADLLDIESLGAKFSGVMSLGNTLLTGLGQLNSYRKGK